MAKLDESKEILMPRKWIKGNGWDVNYDVYKEVFSDAANKIISNDWSKVYVMPWNHVYVVYQKADGCYKVCTKVTKFENFEEYEKAACGA